MELLIIRHGEAVSVGAEGVGRDGDRHLTSRGKEDGERLGRVLAKLDVLPEKVLSSPLTRAQETAMAVLKAAHCDAPIELAPDLRPGATDMGMVSTVKNRARGANRIMLVGHLPDVGKFVGALVAPQGISLAMTPGSMVYVDIDQPEASFTGRMRWFLTPETISGILET